MLAKNQIDKLRIIASRVRKEMDQTAYDHCFWGQELAGMCAIASYCLYVDLKKAGFNPEFVAQRWGDTGFHYHCYLVIDGYIADITATQFGKNSVCVRRDVNWKHNDFWRKDWRDYIDPDDHDWDDWPQEQNPFRWHELVD